MSWGTADDDEDDEDEDDGCGEDDVGSRKNGKPC